MENAERVSCLIIGSGPAGYTAAIYAARANLNPVEYCGLQVGGQLTQTTVIENFPGYPEGVDGNQMMLDLRQQAERFGTDMRDGVIVKADLSESLQAYNRRRTCYCCRHCNHCHRCFGKISRTG